MTYIAYLDEFGHIGPYVSRTDPKHNDSPVFGLAGLALPSDEVRTFGTWFYQRKCELLKFEIERSDKNPAVWEKKGSSLYTPRNITQYKELRQFTFRLLNKIIKIHGFVFFVGMSKSNLPKHHRPRELYRAILREAIKRLDQYCLDDCQPQESFFLVMDEHQQRDELVTEAAISMYNNQHPRRALIEPPFQVESHRYQTVQAADWIAGLIGRLGAFWVSPDAFPENQIVHEYFNTRIHKSCRRSGIRGYG